jgi:hypothetical protein
MKKQTKAKIVFKKIFKFENAKQPKRKGKYRLSKNRAKMIKIRVFRQKIRQKIIEKCLKTFDK